MGDPEQDESQKAPEAIDAKAKLFFEEFGLKSDRRFGKNWKNMYNKPLLSPTEGGNEGILPKPDIRKRFLDLINSTDDGVLEQAFKAAQNVVNGVFISKAPLLWRDRDKSRKLKCTEFVAEVYAPWLDKGLRRHHLKEIDPQLYQTLSTFYSRNGIPTELASLETVDEKITDEFLEKHGIKEPKDAYRVFKDDPKEANRVYSAAHRKLTK